MSGISRIQATRDRVGERRGGGNTSMTTAFEYWTDKPVTRLTKEIGVLFDGNHIN